MEERCINCKHCHKCKELINNELKEIYICTMWLDIGEEKEPLLLSLGDNANNICEVYSERIKE